MKPFRYFLGIVFTAVVFLLAGCSGNPQGSQNRADGPQGRYIEADITPLPLTTAQSYPEPSALRAHADGSLDYLVWQDDKSGVTELCHYRSLDCGDNWETVDTGWIRKIYEWSDSATSGWHFSEMSAFSEMDMDEEGNIYCAVSQENRWGLYKIAPDGNIVKLAQDSVSSQWKDGVEDLRVTEGGNIGVLTFAEESPGMLYDAAFTELARAKWGLIPTAFTDDTIIQEEFRELFFYGARSGSLPLPSQGERGHFSSLEAAAGGGVFIADRYGVHYLGKGASLFETVMQGAHYAYGDPNVEIVLLRSRPGSDDLYMVLDSSRGKKLYRYAFDPSVPMKPETQIEIFSMEEIAAVQGAVVAYQQTDFSVTAHYQVGLAKDWPLTREKVEKSLEDAFRTGKGPDVLILDGLDWRRYVENGWLAAIDSDIPGCMENVTGSLRADGAAYGVPTRFWLWIEVQMPGSKPYLQKITGPTGLAYTLEALKETKQAASLETVPGYLEPSMIVGINAASTKREQAEAFLETMLSPDIQSGQYPGGFPVREEAFVPYLQHGYENTLTSWEETFLELVKRLKAVVQ